MLLLRKLRSALWDGAWEKMFLTPYAPPHRHLISFKSKLKSVKSFVLPSHIEAAVTQQLPASRTHTIQARVISRCVSEWARSAVSYRLCRRCHLPGCAWCCWKREHQEKNKKKLLKSSTRGVCIAGRERDGDIDGALPGSQGRAGQHVVLAERLAERHERHAERRRATVRSRDHTCASKWPSRWRSHS